MWLVLLHFAGAGLHPLLSFLTFQTFSRGDIILITNKVDAVTLVWEDSKELPQVLSLHFMEGAAPKMLVTLNERLGIYYQQACQTAVVCPLPPMRCQGMSILQPGSLPCFLYALHNFGQGTDLAETGRLGNLSIHGQTPFLSSS